jgi:hypothetical protein
MSWVLTSGDSDEELRAQFRGLRQRFEMNEWIPGTVRYVDVNCCRHDGRQSVWQQEFSADCTDKLDAMHFLKRCVNGVPGANLFKSAH